MKKIEEIINHTGRNLINIDEKVFLASMFIFAYGYSTKEFAEILYSDYEKYIENIHNRPIFEYLGDIEYLFRKKEFKEAFIETQKKCIEKYDEDNLYKAVLEGDEYALSICGILDIFKPPVQMDDLIKKLKIIPKNYKYEKSRRTNTF